MKTETSYRRHVIRSKQVAGIWNACAIRGKSRGPLLSGASEQDAILAVKAKLDADAAIKSRSRGADGVPSASEYGAALAVIEMTSAQLSMLKAHFMAPLHTLTATELANAGGYESYTSANSQYGALARRLAEEMEWEPPTVDGIQIWTFALATGTGDGVLTDHAEWRWQLRPQVVAAMNDEGSGF